MMRQCYVCYGRGLLKNEDVCPECNGEGYEII